MTNPFFEVPAPYYSVGEILDKHLDKSGDQVSYYTAMLAEAETRILADEAIIEAHVIQLGVARDRKAAVEAAAKDWRAAKEAAMDAALLEAVEGKPDAYAVLWQAEDFIKQTFWIAGAEFKHQSNDVDDLAVYYDKGLVPSTLKAIVVKVDLQDGDKVAYRAVTGMCSVGAIALARTVQTNSEQSNYGSMARYDFPTRAAGGALANAILDTYFLRYERASSDVESDPENIIAGWNDELPHDNDTEKNRSRAKVVAMFDKALTDPLLDSNEIWMIEEADGYSFPSEEAAVLASRDIDHPVGKWLSQERISSPTISCVMKNKALQAL